MHLLTTSLANETAAAWVTAIGTVAAALIALISVFIAMRQVKKSQAQQAADSEERTRPYVSADFVPGLQGSPVFDIVFENHGRALATDVRLELLGAEFKPQSEMDEIAPVLRELVETPFDLAPGARRRLMWRVAESERSNPPGAAGAPIKAEVHVYYDWHPHDRKVRSYMTSSSYDLTVYPKLTPKPTVGEKVSEDAELGVVQNISRALRTIAVHIGELRR